ncbi:MAG: carboxypeptidase-like regulatory domain-containing protein [Polaribacter sp.]|uniref:carboxypeptidase-like regulatory domain-containing protein n=1 Tax=Polaribacter sp. TaxID=1920175 RepID=UPI003BB2207D
MKKLLLFLLISTSVFSQNIAFKGKLLDEETREPVVYANLSFLNSNKGVSTNEDGTFSMNLDKKYLEAKVHISCLNYKDTIVFAKDIYQKIVYVQSLNILLKEIVLTKQIDQSVVLGEVKNRVEGVHTSGMRMLAKYFPNDKRVKCCSYLETIDIHFAKRSNHRKKAKFRIRIFNKDEKTGLPKDDILNVNLPVEIENGQEKVTVDIKNYNLEMPKNGLFIAFEKLFIPFNEYGKNEIDTENEFYYAPIIGYTSYNKKDRNDNMYLFVKGNWQLSPLNKIKQMEKYAPAISLTLSN